MRNHSQRSRNKLAREGAWAAPNPGRNPRGAKNIEMKPASRSIPSDWYPEKSRAAATNDRKQSRDTSSAARGHKFKTMARDAATPTQQIRSRARSVADHHSNVGAYQKRSQPGSDSVTAER